MPSSVSQATAEIVANQSQDYVDEQLAEFQSQIQQLQGKTKNCSLMKRSTFLTLWAFNEVSTAFDRIP